MWFAGVHSDIGGGYPEKESGLAKLPLGWMINKATSHGLRIDKTLFNHIVNGQKKAGGDFIYVAPDFTAKPHNSMKPGWLPLEWLPKSTQYKEWPQRKTVLGVYLPRSEPRVIPDNAFIHSSAIDKIKNDPTYTPPNTPKIYRIV